METALQLVDRDQAELAPSSTNHRYYDARHHDVQEQPTSDGTLPEEYLLRQ
jgi:hypothetical protein